MKDWDADMYLLFRPTGGFPVPMRVVNWHWGGEATWNGQKWIEANLDPKNASDISGAVAAQFPAWTQNIIDLPYNPPL